ncbi:TPA: TraU family protein, partial [Legionella pneumophila]|nr:TraU family protein [Legionella pneumophila]
MCFRRLIFMILFLGFAPLNAKQCTGHFVNPVTDVCWRCLFPLSIGNAKVVSSSLPDTENASSPIGVCPSSTGVRIGLNIGFWEPMALTDVTDTPYCL